MRFISEECERCELRHHHDKEVTLAKQSMPEEDVLYDLADFFKVFADSTRIKILFVLLKQELCVCDIADSLNISQSAISHQLRTLKQMDLVRNRREGKAIYYSLADDHIVTILQQGLNHINE